MTMAEKTKLLPHHERVLAVLNARTAPYGEKCSHFAPIARDAEMDVREVRRIVRRLARRGFAEFHSTLITEEGDLAGAGYCITPEGQKLVPEVNEEPAF
jgi:predicted transcriptional regulator